MTKRKKILLYGAKSTALIVLKMLEEKKIKVHRIYDKFVKKPTFRIHILFIKKIKIRSIRASNDNFGENAKALSLNQ